MWTNCIFDLRISSTPEYKHNHNALEDVLQEACYTGSSDLRAMVHMKFYSTLHSHHWRHTILYSTLCFVAKPCRSTLMPELKSWTSHIHIAEVSGLLAEHPLNSDRRQECESSTHHSLPEFTKRPLGSNFRAEIGGWGKSIGSQGKYLPRAVLPLSLGLPGKKTTYRAENNVSTTIRFKTVISCRAIFKFSFKIRTVLGSAELLRSTELFFFYRSYKIKVGDWKSMWTKINSPWVSSGRDQFPQQTALQTK